MILGALIAERPGTMYKGSTIYLTKCAGMAGCLGMPQLGCSTHVCDCWVRGFAL